MTEQHQEVFEEAKKEAYEASQRLGQYKDAKPGSLGPMSGNMREHDIARLLDAYKRLLGLEFRYKSDSDVAGQIAFVESQLVNYGIPFEMERDRQRETLQHEYTERRRLAEQVQQNVQAWRGSIFGGRFDRNQYVDQLNLLERLADEGISDYPEDAAFPTMKEQATAFRSEIGA